MCIRDRYYGAEIDNGKLPATLYLDNFCLTDSDSLPGCKHAATVTQNAKAATCTQNGYTGDQICSVCGKTVVEGQTVNAPVSYTHLMCTAMADLALQTGGELLYTGCQSNDIALSAGGRAHYRCV